MRAVWSWLKELCDFERDVTVDEVSATFTSLGLEVEKVENLASDFAGVVIAEVVATRKHPEADKLTIVAVRDADGGATTEVVCGAPNVPAPGGRVLWARPGAVLPGGTQIGKKKLKGVESAGMLCSETELGIGTDESGIVVLAADEQGAPLGAAAQDALRLRDVVFELSISANRPDLLGHVGLARELVARLGGRLLAPAAALAEVEGPSPATGVALAIDDPDGCPRYTARAITGVKVAPSPRWLRWRLAAVGVRPISNLVDVTNYVMFESGQPLHAFDATTLTSGTIRVRRARAGERMTTLDDVERALEPTDLLICDGERPIALAGVMGGRDSEVGDATTNVLLESAGFQPLAVRRTSRRLGLRSEASQRFERGVDPAGAEAVSARAAYLLAKLGGGKVARVVVDAYPRPPARAALRFRPARASALTGVALSAELCRALLERLGVAVATEAGDDALVCTPPSHRVDLDREVDLIEDVIRLHGFAHVPATLPSAAVVPRRASDPRPAMARRALCAAGLDEAITFGFTSAARIAALGFAVGDRRAAPLALKNPMSLEHGVMRTTLIGNLLGALARNRKHQIEDVRLFEVGRVFLRPTSGAADALPDEPTHVAGVLAGPRGGWLVPDGTADFFDAKGAVERLLGELLGPRVAAVRYVPGGEPWLHPGVSARVELGGRPLGVVGEVHPAVRAAFEIEEPCFGFELELDGFPPPDARQMQAIHRFPANRRDLSFLVAADISADRIRDLLLGGGDPLVEGVRLLEDYRDPSHVPAGKKGMLWSVTYRSHERTLTDAEVDAQHEKRVAHVLGELGATRR
jgi:phenylalanyl-tRNA synthetase beta chain